MIDIAGLTVFHTVLSFIGIFLGVGAVMKMLDRDVTGKLVKWFLVAAVATTVTGFLFPFKAVTPAFATGIAATVTLALVYIALYIFHLKSLWRWVYIGGVVFNIYLLFFVLVAQGFLKVAFLNALAPTLSEPPFAVAQLVMLVIFVTLGIRILKRNWG